MVTLTAARAASTFPVYSPAGEGSGILCAAYGVYNLATAPSAADIIKFCKIPAGAVVLGGFLRGQDIDSGTASFDIDIGWADNGVEAVNSLGFGDFGVLNGTAVTNYLPEGGFMLPLNGALATGPVSFTKETTITGTIVAAANAGGTGYLTVVVHYIVP